MSDISAYANRVLPVDVELYDKSIEEFPDQHTVGKDDSEFKLQLTLQNKDASSPYAVAASDLTNIDKVEYYFYPPNQINTIVRKAEIATAASGITFLSIDTKILNTVGLWRVQAVCTEGDVTITYPIVLIYVE